MERKGNAVLTCPYEDEGGVQRDVGEEGEVLEGVLLGPGPDADGQDTQTEQLEIKKVVAIAHEIKYHFLPRR